jgi:hypothetical protein
LIISAKEPRPQFFGFGFTDLRVGGHWDLTPSANATLDDFGGQLVDSRFVASVFGRDILVRRTHKLGGNRMAGHAILGSGQGLIGHCRNGYRSGSKQGNQKTFHHFLVD